MKVLVIGRAAKVWEEVAAAKSMTTFDKVVVVNVAGQDYPEPFDYWVSYHPGFFSDWVARRRRKGYPFNPENTQFWSGIVNGRKLATKHLREFVQHANYMGGSSGLLGARIARDVAKGTRIILCGIPMENTARYDDRQAWREALAYRQVWLDVLPLLQPYVRSMSGWTREQLGGPTKEWLDEMVLEESGV